MKASLLHTIGALALTFGIAACVPRSEAPPPPPVQTPPPPPAPAPAPVVQQPEYPNYLDAPQTPGNWLYQDLAVGSRALFETRDPATAFEIRCTPATREIALVRPVTAQRGAVMKLTAETMTRSLTAQPVAGSGAASGGLAVRLDARNPLLDAIAITKGRFAVETEGMRTLYLPAWTEVSRVIEDCR